MTTITIFFEDKPNSATQQINSPANISQYEAEIIARDITKGNHFKVTVSGVNNRNDKKKEVIARDKKDGALIQAVLATGKGQKVKQLDEIVEEASVLYSNTLEQLVD